MGGAPLSTGAARDGRTGMAEGPPRLALWFCRPTENNGNSASAPTSMMGATRPSPRMVAPISPSTLCRFFSRLFTTTCCWPKNCSDQQSNLFTACFHHDYQAVAFELAEVGGPLAVDSVSIASAGTARKRASRSTGMDSSRITMTSACSARRLILPVWHGFDHRQQGKDQGAVGHANQAGPRESRGSAGVRWRQSIPRLTRW